MELIKKTFNRKTIEKIDDSQDRLTLVEADMKAFAL